MGIFLFFALLLVILGLALFVYAQSQGIDIRKVNVAEAIRKSFEPGRHGVGPEDVNIIPYDLKEHPEFIVYKDTIVKVTRDYIKGLNKKGEEQWMLQTILNDPMVRTNGTDLLVGDRGGKTLFLINGKTVKWETKLQNNLVDMHLNDRGYIALIHEAQGYKGAVTVMDSQGNEFFTRYIAEKKFPVGAKVSASGKTVAINSIDISDVTVATCIDFGDINGQDFISRLRPDVLLASMFFVNNEELLLAGDNFLVCYDKDREEKWSLDYKNSRIYSVYPVSTKYAAVACSDISGESVQGAAPTEIQILDNEGRKTASYHLDGNVSNMAAEGDMIAVNTGKEVHFINDRGTLVKKYVSKSEVEKVSFFNSQEALVITKSDVLVMKIN